MNKTDLFTTYTLPLSHDYATISDISTAYSLFHLKTKSLPSVECHVVNACEVVVTVRNHEFDHSEGGRLSNFN